MVPDCSRSQSKEQVDEEMHTCRIVQASGVLDDSAALKIAEKLGARQLEEARCASVK